MNETYCIKKLEDFHPSLYQIPEIPKNLRFLGTLPSYENKYVTIVGSRSCTKYGLDAVEKIISELDKDIYVVSGMANGIDTAVHEASIKHGLKTIAFPGSGLHRDVIYPQNFSLIDKIIQSGGCLISEYEDKAKSLPWMFIKRNRLMAGISAVTVVIEAQEKSGTLVTARMAMDYNREVGAVPGSIFSKSSTGSNNLIKEGATPIRNAGDIHELLHINTQPTLLLPKSYDDCSSEELVIIKSLEFLGNCNREDLIRKTEMPISLFNRSLSLLEIKGYILFRNNIFSLKL